MARLRVMAIALTNLPFDLLRTLVIAYGAGGTAGSLKS